MASSPSSVGNRIKLDPLTNNINSVAYNSGYIELATVEPSLGLPTGFTYTEQNSAYYFPVFGISDSYLNSRKFTGNDSLLIKNGNLGINNPNPTYNVDISGNIKADDGYIVNLNTSYLYGDNTLTFNYPKGIIFNSDVIFNSLTVFNNLSARSIETFYLNAAVFNYRTKIINVYEVNSLNVSFNTNINASLTANNLVVNDNINTSKLSADNSYIRALSADNIFVKNDLVVNRSIRATNSYGKIEIDDSSALYYNNQNQLSLSVNKNYYFAIRPSDGYSTDDINIARSVNGISDGGYEEPYVLKPYFKNIQAVIDFAYTNGIFGNNLVIWVDEDIIAGENKANNFTVDDSGNYTGCTINGNVSSAFYSSEYLRDNHANLYFNGIKGGDFIWPKNNNVDMVGQYYYINLYPLKFNNITIQGRYELGTYVNSDFSKYYSTWKPFNFAPRKISFRTYICSNPEIPFNSFDNTDADTWTNVYTKNSVIGRPVQFNQSQSVNLNIINLCFEFFNNSIDSSALVFYNGNSNLSNVTVSLLGKGIYTYGALNVESELATVHVCGGNHLDPYYLTSNSFNVKAWNTWLDYGYSNPNYFPGYGLAIVGNPVNERGTIVNYSESLPYTGLINVRDGGKLSFIDYGVRGREIGLYSAIQSSVILDGNFYANSLFNLDNRASLTIQQNLFKTENFSLTSKYISYNNKNTNPTYNIEILNQNLNFKYLNFNGSFATYIPLENTLANWSFKLENAIQGPLYNTYLNIFNGVYDDSYIFNNTLIPKFISLDKSVNSIGKINSLQSSAHNTYDKMYYVDLFNIKNYNEFGIFNLNSPTQQTNTNYTLNFYTESNR